jgi:hypothetical protein
VLVTVACETGQDVFILLDVPLWRVMYLFHHLQEREARLQLRGRLARVDMGYLNAFAFNHPESLETEMQHVNAAIVALDRPPVSRRSEVEELRARGQAMVARIQREHVLSDEALVS